MKNHQPCSNAPEAWQAIREVLARVDGRKKPDHADVQRLRELVVSSPQTWEWAAAMPAIRESLIEAMGHHGSARACLFAEVDVLSKELGRETAPPLERLLIDHVLTVHVRLIQVENSYNQQMSNRQMTFKECLYWNDLLSSAQARFLRAVESLARIRRLARNGPAVQINIARAGGKQVNMQAQAAF